MSRIGKLPVDIPEKVQVSVADSVVKVKGPNGELEFTYPDTVTVEMIEKQVIVKPVSEEKKAISMWGTARKLISNMVEGVSTGFTKSLEFNGVGYKAAVSGQNMTLNLGYSHPIEYPLPQGVSAKVERNIIHVTGCDKELVGFVAAKIRSFRPPEPYKGKGIKYTTETIIRKAGKSGGK